MTTSVDYTHRWELSLVIRTLIHALESVDKETIQREGEKAAVHTSYLKVAKWVLANHGVET